MSQRNCQTHRVRLNADMLKTCLSWLVRGADWRPICWRDDCTWKVPQLLAFTTLMWAWSDEALVGERFDTARSIALQMFPQEQSVASTFQAFMKLLRRWTPQFVQVLQQTLRARTADELSDCMMVGGFLLFGVDGSRIELPRTLAHEREFSSARKKKGAKKSKSKKAKPMTEANRKKTQTASMWITTLWHMGTGLPWDWRLGPSDSSERSHWMEMLASIKKPAMFVCDAGFAGYEYASTVLSAGHHLTIRVGANVSLLKGLGFAKEQEGLVYLWPSKAAKRNYPPLVFRLVVVDNGKHPVYLLTSVLSTKLLSNNQVIGIYKRRWGIELFYRHLKQTFGKRKLKSTSPKSAYVEMHWSMLGLWCMALYGIKQLAKQGVSSSRLSFAKLLRAFRRIMRDSLHPVTKGKTLCDLVNDSLIDTYQRSDKTSRDYPRKKVETPPGKPIIRSATKQQKAHAIRLSNAA